MEGPGVAAAERPRVRGHHIVCAEPMPGEGPLEEFVGDAQPPLLRPARSQMAFPEMRLAGELGLAPEGRERKLEDAYRSGTAPVVAGHRAGAARALPRAPGAAREATWPSSTPTGITDEEVLADRSKRSCSRH